MGSLTLAAIAFVLPSEWRVPAMYPAASKAAPANSARTARVNCFLFMSFSLSEGH